MESNENKTEQTELELLVDLHKNQKRQGPGSTSMTKMALDLIREQGNEPLKIADIGCGTGAQTIILAKYTDAKISAVDIFPEFLSKLDQNAKELGFSKRITTIKGSMENLEFQPEEFDIIWSEGAIYIMGFETGVREWNKFLKPGGFLAVSELSWITNSRPKTLEQYWEKEYPQIDTVSNKIKIMEQNNYTPVAHFVLPPNCWNEQYYWPIQDTFGDFLSQHEHSALSQSIIEAERKEIEIYDKYKQYYSYGFYIVKKM